uniref:High mobility group B protein 1 n=1 Tax=Rhizophora mucronata TaxID=61149 RepID=A0A2P2MC95_RHIMU
MTSAEKAPYEAKAAKKKADYGKLMNAYNKKQSSTTDDGNEESDRSKSEVNDEEVASNGEVSISNFSWIVSPLAFHVLSRPLGNTYDMVIS